MYKYEMHLHTAEGDPYARMSAREIVRAYCEKGYSGMVVTDHYFAMAFDWFENDVGQMTPENFLRRWQKGYFEARDEGEKLGFTVLSGAEVRFDGPNINDYLVYGLEAEDFYRLPLLNRCKDVKELVSVLPEHCCVVQAHPFRDGMTVESPDHLFGIEVYNGGTSAYRNQMARSYAEHYDKPMLSGSDMHCREQLGRGGVEFEKKINTSRELTEALRAGNYKLITT